MKKLLWNHNPKRCHLKVPGQHPSYLCPICREIDRLDQFLKCEILNSSKKKEILNNETSHKENTEGIPDHMINAKADVIIGKQVSHKKLPRYARQVHDEQEELGWANHIRVMIVKRWSEVKNTNVKVILDMDSRWTTKMIKWVLQ